MASADNNQRGKKRSKAFYRKSSYGGKRQCTGKNVLQPGIKGFLVMCHNNESSAVRESYNILNEYGDQLYGPDKTQPPPGEKDNNAASGNESEEDCEDIEKALKKEVEGIKSVTPTERRFQNIATKAKNLVFIRTTLDDPVKVVTTVMEDIAERKLMRARYAARMLPIVGTCKAQTAAIVECAKESLALYFAKDNNPNVPLSFTVIFKARNNNGTTCGKESVIPGIKKEVLAINPDLQFSWSDFDVAILVEIVCTVCCIGLAPGFERLRKYNFQELAQGPKVKPNQKVECSLITNQQPSTLTVESGSNEKMANDSVKASERVESNKSLEANEAATQETKKATVNDSQTCVTTLISSPNEDSTSAVAAAVAPTISSCETQKLLDQSGDANCAIAVQNSLQPPVNTEENVMQSEKIAYKEVTLHTQTPTDLQTNSETLLDKPIVS